MQKKIKSSVSVAKGTSFKRADNLLCNPIFVFFYVSFSLLRLETIACQTCCLLSPPVRSQLWITHARVKAEYSAQLPSSFPADRFLGQLKDSPSPCPCAGHAWATHSWPEHSNPRLCWAATLSTSGEQGEEKGARCARSGDRRQRAAAGNPPGSLGSGTGVAGARSQLRSLPRMRGLPHGQERTHSGSSRRPRLPGVTPRAAHRRGHRALLSLLAFCCCARRSALLRGEQQSHGVRERAGSVHARVRALTAPCFPARPAPLNRGRRCRS